MMMTPLWTMIIFLPGIIVAQVFLNPPDVFVSYPGGSARFVCFPISSQTTVSIQWLLNGTLLESLNLSNVTQSFSRDNDITSGALRFAYVPLSYNNTIVQCSAEYTTGSSAKSQSVPLLLQGVLSAVGLISFAPKDRNLSLSWEAPYSLNITGNNYITYCVEVVNSTFLIKPHSMMCGITAPSITYAIPPEHHCHRITITVTPVNVVGNGTSRTETYAGTEFSPEIIEADLSNGILVMAAPMCTVKLTILDIDTGTNNSLKRTELNISGSNISISRLLQDNHRYTITVMASNIAGSASSELMISTHDIRNATVTEEDAEIVVETDYFEHSSASGALYIFVPLDDSGAADLTGAVYLALDTTTSRNHKLPFSLSGGELAVFVYDIESDGTLASGVGYPAVNMEIVANGTTQGLFFQPSYTLLDSCQVSTSQGFIEAMCTYTNAIGFQVVVQQMNLVDLSDNEVEKIYTGKTADRQTSARVEVEENGLYQVTIFAIEEESGIAGSPVEFMQMLALNDVPATTTDSESTPVASLAPEDEGLVFAGAIGGGIVFALIVLMSIVLLLGYVYYKRRQLESYRPDEFKYENENDWQPHLQDSAASIDSKDPDGDVGPVPMYESVDEKSPATRARNGRVRGSPRGTEADSSPALRTRPVPAVALSLAPPDVIPLYESSNATDNYMDNPPAEDTAFVAAALPMEDEDNLITFYENNNSTNKGVDNPPAEDAQSIEEDTPDPLYAVVDSKNETKKPSASKVVPSNQHAPATQEISLEPGPLYAVVDSREKSPASNSNSHIIPQIACEQQMPETEGGVVSESAQHAAAAAAPELNQSSSSSSTQSSDAITPHPVSSEEDIPHLYAMVDKKPKKQQHGVGRATGNKNPAPITSHLVPTEESITITSHPEQPNSAKPAEGLSPGTAVYSVVDLSRKHSRRRCRENKSDSKGLHPEQPMSSDVPTQAVSDEAREDSQPLDSSVECPSPVPATQQDEDEEEPPESPHLYAVVDKSKKASRKAQNHGQNTTTHPSVSAPPYHQEMAGHHPHEAFASGVAVEESIHALNARENQYEDVAPIQLKDDSNNGMGVFRIRGSTPPPSYPTGTADQQVVMEDLQPHMQGGYSFITPVQEEQRRFIPHHQGVRGDLIAGYPDEEMMVTDV